MSADETCGKVDLAALTTFLADSQVAPCDFEFVRRKVLCLYADASIAQEAGARNFRDREFSVIDVAARKLVVTR